MENILSQILWQKNRPGEEDFELADKLCDLIIQRLNQDKITSVSPVNVKGENPIRPYFKPKDRNGKFIDIRKVRPKINNNCNHCKVCAEVCPMEAIDKDDIHKYNNICIKCGACIKNALQTQGIMTMRDIFTIKKNLKKYIQDGPKVKYFKIKRRLICRLYNKSFLLFSVSFKDSSSIYSSIFL